MFMVKTEMKKNLGNSGMKTRRRDCKKNEKNVALRKKAKCLNEKMRKKKMVKINEDSQTKSAKKKRHEKRKTYLDANERKKKHG